MVFSLLASVAGPAGISLAWSIPFVVLLLSIALGPLLNAHWWEKHYPKVALSLGVIPVIYYFLIARAPGAWLGAMEEYVSFIILLASLFVISGGINIRVNRTATPLANTVLLLIGSIIANIFCTTGASMLLIRPYLRMNRNHVKPYHVVFFIFTVSNCGGLLTPIGDPPLFLGYLNGIPFGWTLEHLWPVWLVCIGALLAVFFIVDTVDSRKAARPNDSEPGPRMQILGIHNFIFISAVAIAVFRPGIFEVFGEIKSDGLTAGHALGVVLSRELLMVAAMLLSRSTTSREIYTNNQFNYGPIREVAILFIGIFSTMAPALGWLSDNASKMHVETPGQFYFTTGVLSSVLDNAPTYLTFLQIRRSELPAEDVQAARAAIDEMTVSGTLAVPAEMPQGDARSAVEALAISHPDQVLSRKLKDDTIRVAFLIGVPRLNAFIVAISAGAVLFGACTYIGNGPNFMIKSIADSAGIKMPTFLGYIVKYTLPILVPIYVAVWLIFVR